MRPVTPWSEWGMVAVVCPAPAVPQSVQWGDLAKEILLSPWLLVCLEAEMAGPLRVACLL